MIHEIFGKPFVYGCRGHSYVRTFSEYSDVRGCRDAGGNISFFRQPGVLILCAWVRAVSKVAILLVKWTW
jgi:hypothetical protein